MKYEAFFKKMMDNVFSIHRCCFLLYFDLKGSKVCTTELTYIDHDRL